MRRLKSATLNVIDDVQRLNRRSEYRNSITYGRRFLISSIRIYLDVILRGRTQAHTAVYAFISLLFLQSTRDLIKTQTGIRRTPVCNSTFPPLKKTPFMLKYITNTIRPYPRIHFLPALPVRTDKPLAGPDLEL